MAQPYLSIVIPAYNEAERIPAALLAMDRHLSTVDYSYEIIVVNDGSTDNTAVIVQSMERMVRNLKLITVAQNHGKGDAVRQGMLAATGTVRIFTDADNSTSIDQFERMMPFFKEGYGIVIGSRAVHGATLDPPEPRYRRVIGKILNMIVQILLVPGIWDTQCGFKAYTMDSAERIFHASRINGWGFDVETLALGRAMGYRIKEMPIHWADDTRSHVRFSAGLQFLSEIGKIRWWLWRDEYGLKGQKVLHDQDN